MVEEALLGILQELQRSRRLQEVTIAALQGLTAVVTANQENTERCIKELVEGAVVNVVDPPAEEIEKNRYGR